VKGRSPIALIDYGAGNTPSVERALQRLGAESARVTEGAELKSARAIVLPGVGHYAAIIRALDVKDLRQGLLEAIRRGVPFLGICLGLQALYAGSEEAPELLGLGVLPGRAGMLPETVKLPHMGWNQVRITKCARLLQGLSGQDFFYFAHSFAARGSAEEVAATCSHGAEFAAVIERDNMFATQFHPEKSGASGARLLENFVRMAE
jgi:imidazole glycerol phosphate synthase glutamine amidotransferase subunit